MFLPLDQIGNAMHSLLNHVTQMTDEQINAAIAEACGWTDIGECENGGFRLRGFPSDRFEAHRKPIPNYCGDLNAMHEAEKVLAPKNWDRFSEKWWEYYHHLLDGDVHKTIHATARQRAEAFLKTLGKWEESE
jgi:hypothetical protein